MNRQKLFLILFAVVLLLCSSLIFGEIKTLTLSNAVEMALKNNLQIKQIESDVKAAEAQFSQSWADFWLPGVNLSAGLNYIDPTTADNSKIYLPNITNTNITTPFGKIPTLIPNGVLTDQSVYSDNYSAGVSITKSLFAGFRLKNAMDIKKINLDLAKMKLSDKKKEIENNVNVSFYNLFLIRENIRITIEMMNNTKDRLDFTTENFKAGSVAKYDKIRAEVQYKNTFPILTRVTNAYMTAKIAFCNLIGVNDSDSVEFIGDLIDSTNYVFSETDMDVLLKEAISNSIDIRTIDYSLESLKINKEIAASGKYPVLSAYFNYQYDYRLFNPTNTDRTFVGSWNTGLQFSMPIDQWLPVSKTAASVSEADANIAKLEFSRSQIIDGLKLQLKTFLMQMKEARDTIASQKETVRLAKISLDLANERYKVGVTSSIEVTDNLTSYNQAEVDYLQAIYDYYSSSMRLKRLVD